MTSGRRIAPRTRGVGGSRRTASASHCRAHMRDRRAPLSRALSTVCVSSLLCCPLVCVEESPLSVVTHTRIPTPSPPGILGQRHPFVHSLTGLGCRQISGIPGNNLWEDRPPRPPNRQICALFSSLASPRQPRRSPPAAAWCPARRSSSRPRYMPPPFPPLAVLHPRRRRLVVLPRIPLRWHHRCRRRLHPECLRACADASAPALLRKWWLQLRWPPAAADGRPPAPSHGRRAHLSLTAAACDTTEQPEAVRLIC